MPWTGSDFALALTFEGLGDAAAGASSKLYRFATRGISSDPDGLYEPSLLSWPRQMGSSVNFRSLDVTGAGLTAQIKLSSRILSHFFGVVPPRVARLSATLTSSATTIDLDSSSLASTTLFLEREAIRTASGAPTSLGGGLYRYTCTRGVLGTQALAHAAGELDDTEVFAAHPPHALSGRVVSLLRVPVAGGYSGESTRWMGRLRRIQCEAGEEGVYAAIEADSILQALKGTQIYRNPWRGSVVYNPGTPQAPENGAPFSYLILRPAPTTPSPVNSTAPLIMIEGVGAFRGSDAVELYEAGELPRGVFAGEFQRALEGPAFSSAPPDGAEVREVFSSFVDVPTTGKLSQEPGKLALQLLLTTPQGGNHATYDLALAPLAGGVPASLVDVDSFLDWNESVQHVRLDAFHLGVESGEAVDLFEVIQKKILGPLGASLAQGSAGTLTVVRLTDAIPYGNGNTLDTSGIARESFPILYRAIEDTLDRVRVMYAHRPIIGPDVIEARDVRRYQRQPNGEHDTLDLHLHTSSSSAAQDAAHRLIQHFHAPVDTIRLSTLRHTGDYWLGDVVVLTLAHIPSLGARGIASSACLVVGRSEDLSADGHTVTLELLNVGAKYDRTGYIAPAGVVASYTGSGPAYNLTLSANTYTSASDGPLSADAQGFAVGDVCQLCDQYGAVRDAAVTVSSVSGNSVGITGCSVAPAAGDVLRVAAYGSAVATQQTTWAFLADSADELGSGDAGKQYQTG